MLCLLLCVICISSKQKVEAKEYNMYVKSNFATAREGTSTSSKTVKIYKIGQKLTCTGQKGSYTKILYKGQKAYVLTSKLTKKKLATAKVLKGMSTSAFIKYIGPLAQKDYHRSGILASVTIAQAYLETGYGQSELCQKANNLFGMKKVISHNTWKGSLWTGMSYKKRTAEYKNGTKKYYITAYFRKYNSLAQSIADHSAYLINSKKDDGSTRYKGITATTSYKKQLSIIQKGGYATSKYYSKHLAAIIKTYNLTKYDK